MLTSLKSSWVPMWIWIPHIFQWGWGEEHVSKNCLLIYSTQKSATGFRKGTRRQGRRNYVQVGGGGRIPCRCVTMTFSLLGTDSAASNPPTPIFYYSENLVKKVTLGGRPTRIANWGDLCPRNARDPSGGFGSSWGEAYPRWHPGSLLVHNEVSGK